jgi:predicted extracellular nuclease
MNERFFSLSRRIRVLIVFTLISILSIGLYLPAQQTFASTPTDLIISEYIEGSVGNTKALELYNGTDTDIDLAAGGYRIQIFANGSATAGFNQLLTGTVPAGGTFVIAHSYFATNYPSVVRNQTLDLNYNGDDAVALVKGTSYIDVIGQIGTDPGTEWANNGISTLDQSLRRLPTVCTGDTDGSNAFDPSIEWEKAAAANDVTGLGTHTANCDSSTTPTPSEEPSPTEEPTPITPTATLAPGVCPTPPATLMEIGEIQGTGLVSPVAGETRTMRGVVTADLQGASGMNGFFIQDPDGDGDANTSDGIFIYVPSANAAWFTFDVEVGDYVQVTGRVTEFQSQTEIDNVTAISKCGADPSLPTITPVALSLPESFDGELEQYEGMLIEINQALTVSQNYFLGRYGQLTMSANGRLHNPTNLYPAGSQDALDLMDENARRIIILDDARSGQNPNPIPYIGIDNTVRAGDTTTSPIVGILDQGAINSDTSIVDYRIQALDSSSITFSRDNPRTAAPDLQVGDLKVASFNVLNYYTTIDQSGAQCYPGMVQGDCRGADSAAELERQSAKIVAALAAIDADIVGLIEIENNGDVAINDLVNKLNAEVGAGTYATVATAAGIGGSSPVNGGGDTIKTAFIYKPATVNLVGASVALDDVRFAQSRAPLAQTFEHIATGEQFSVIVNHFKSKRCDDATGAESDQGDGQGCWVPLRVSQAQALLDFVTTIQNNTNDDDVLIIGDLNSYGMEDPILELTSNGIINQVSKHAGATAYSYVFDGLAGYMDHALSTSSFDSSVLDATIWNINSDEPSVIDYNTEFKPQDLYEPSPYSSSDHDPVVLSLQFEEPTPTATPTESPTTTTPTTTTPTTTTPTTTTPTTTTPSPTPTTTTPTTTTPTTTTPSPTPTTTTPTTTTPTTTTPSPTPTTPVETPKHDIFLPFVDK